MKDTSLVTRWSSLQLLITREVPITYTIREMLTQDDLANRKNKLDAISLDWELSFKMQQPGNRDKSMKKKMLLSLALHPQYQELSPENLSDIVKILRNTAGADLLTSLNGFIDFAKNQNPLIDYILNKVIPIREVENRFDALTNGYVNEVLMLKQDKTECKRLSSVLFHLSSDPEFNHQGLGRILHGAKNILVVSKTDDFRTSSSEISRFYAEVLSVEGKSQRVHNYFDWIGSAPATTESLDFLLKIVSVPNRYVCLMAFFEDLFNLYKVNRDKHNHSIMIQFLMDVEEWKRTTTADYGWLGKMMINVIQILESSNNMEEAILLHCPEVLGYLIETLFPKVVQRRDAIKPAKIPTEILGKDLSRALRSKDMNTDKEDEKVNHFCNIFMKKFHRIDDALNHKVNVLTIIFGRQFVVAKNCDHLAKNLLDSEYILDVVNAYKGPLIDFNQIKDDFAAFHDFCVNVFHPPEAKDRISYFLKCSIKDDKIEQSELLLAIVGRGTDDHSEGNRWKVFFDHLLQLFDGINRETHHFSEAISYLSARAKSFGNGKDYKPLAEKVHNVVSVLKLEKSSAHAKISSPIVLSIEKIDERFEACLRLQSQVSSLVFKELVKFLSMVPRHTEDSLMNQQEYLDFLVETALHIKEAPNFIALHDPVKVAALICNFVVLSRNPNEKRYESKSIEFVKDAYEKHGDFRIHFYEGFMETVFCVKNTVGRRILAQILAHLSLQSDDQNVQLKNTKNAATILLSARKILRAAEAIEPHLKPDAKNFSKLVVERDQPFIQRMAHAMCSTDTFHKFPVEVYGHNDKIRHDAFQRFNNL